MTFMRKPIFGLCLLLITIVGVLAGCVVFHPRPLNPSQTAASFESRTLSDPGLKRFMETNFHREVKTWPPEEWDIDMLMLAAFYYSPYLDIAREGWRASKAGIKTASSRPNPTFSFTPQFNADSPGDMSPWTLGFAFDVPVETAGKRSFRSEQAEYLSEAARLNIASAAWQVRRQLRMALLDLCSVNKREDVLLKQVSEEEETAKLLEKMALAGEVSKFEAATAYISLDKARLTLSEIQRQGIEAKARLAGALGLPLGGIDEVKISFNSLEWFPASLPSDQVRRRALLGRPDVLRALAEYSAAESSVGLEIAKQYPDIHLGPGYSWDQGANKWAIGFSIPLPVFNNKEGPIAEAEARRSESRSRFLAIQAKAIIEIERAMADYKVAYKRVESVDSLLTAQKGQMESVRKMFEAGESDRLALLTAQLEYRSSEISRLDELLKAQRSLGAIEDAVQVPLVVMEMLSTLQENPAREENK